MRLAITQSGFYNADMYCSDAKQAKKILKEHPISILAIDFYLKGRSNGSDIIQWAHRANVLPAYVILLERDRSKRSTLANSLASIGFRTSDMTTFIKSP